MRQLVEAGLVLRNDQQRGRRGRFSIRRYVVVAVLFFRRATVRHGGRTSSRSLYKERTKSLLNPPTEQISDQDQAYREEAIRKKDRKRTRLNSSHANISYAVFCLKKKIMIIMRTI